MNNKYRAVWAVALLFIVFLGLLLAYITSHPAPQGPALNDVATTTPEVADEPVHIVDSGPYHDIDVSYPSATPLKSSLGAEADAAVVAAMRTFAQNSVDTFKESAQAEVPGLGEFARDRKYTMDIDYEVYAGPKTVSYVYAIYQDTLGAHPNTYYRTFTFNRTTGEAVALDDLFAPGAAYLDRLSTITRRDLPVIMGRMAQTGPENVDADYINSGTMPISDSFGNFAIEGATLLMIFPPYQVGPYVYGVITDPIPLAELNDILMPAYRP